MPSFKERLEAMNETWSQRKDANVGGVAPGTYNARLQSAVLGMNSKDEMQAVVEYLVMEGEQAGNVARDYMQLETEKGPAFFRKFLEMLGYECPDDPKEIEDLLAQITASAPAVKIKVTPRKDSDFTNLRLLRRLDDDDVPAVPVNETADHGNDDDYDPDADADAAQESAEAGESSESDGDSDGDAITRIDFAALQTFCEGYGIEGVDESNAKDQLGGFDWDANTLTPEEAELLHAVGVTVKNYKPKPAPAPVKKTPPAKTPPPATPAKATPPQKTAPAPATTGKAAPPKKTPASAAPAAPSEEKLVEDAKKFCGEYGVDFGKTRTSQGFGKLLGEYQWNAADVTPAEAKLLKALGVEVASKK